MDCRAKRECDGTTILGRNLQKTNQEAEWPPVSSAPRLRGGITSKARIKQAGTSHDPESIRITIL